MLQGSGQVLSQCLQSRPEYSCKPCALQNNPGAFFLHMPSPYRFWPIFSFFPPFPLTRGMINDSKVVRITFFTQNCPLAYTLSPSRVNESLWGLDIIQCLVWKFVVGGGEVTCFWECITRGCVIQVKGKRAWWKLVLSLH